MEHLKNINKNTLDDLSDYLSLHNPPGLILQGQPGLGKAHAARYVAGRLLGCEEKELLQNPDYFETPSSTPLKVEDIEQLIDKSQRCSIGERKIFVIFHAHTITRRSQNRLLKLLEDRAEKNTLILTSEEDKLLDTIKSRCYLSFFHPLNEKEMKQYLTEHNIEERYLDLVCYLTDNSPYSFLSKEREVEDYISCYQKMGKITMREDLLIIFQVIQEKSSSDFYSIHADNPIWNVRLLLYPFYQYILGVHWNCSQRDTFPDAFYSSAQVMEILLHGLDHLSMLHTSYTRNDYFNLIRFIVEMK